MDCRQPVLFYFTTDNTHETRVTFVRHASYLFRTLGLTQFIGQLGKASSISHLPPEPKGQAPETHIPKCHYDVCTIGRVGGLANIVCGMTRESIVRREILNLRLPASFQGYVGKGRK